MISFIQRKKEAFASSNKVFNQRRCEISPHRRATMRNAIVLVIVTSLIVVARLLISARVQKSSILQIKRPLKSAYSIYSSNELLSSLSSPILLETINLTSPSFNPKNDFNKFTSLEQSYGIIHALFWNN